MRSMYVKKDRRDIHMEYTDHLDQAEFTRLARISRDSASAAVDSWELIPISGGQSGALVYRAKGTGTDLERPFNWSLILKNCSNIGQWGDVYAADDPCWQREMLIYQSDLLAGIPGGLRPPRLVDASRQSPTEIALWLEDVGDSWSEQWSLERYNLAAFHLGQFNAHYADRPPQDTWLGRDQWSKYVGNECMGGIGGLEKNRDHPEVLAVYPRTIQQRLFALRDDSADFIARANARSTSTLYHGDASGRNLYDYQSDTVAIDWFSASPTGF